MINSLNELIDKHGAPIALIDNWNDQYIGYAVWEFEQTLIWNNKGLFLNDTLQENPSLDVVQDIINEWKMQSDDISIINYISYNFKNILFPHIPFKKHNDEFPLFFIAKPKKIIKYKIQNHLCSLTENFSLYKDILTLKNYKDIILKIKKELFNGNVYQINFTMPKKYLINDSALSIYMYFRNIAQPKFGYYLNYKNLKVLSFSPEQFFNKKKQFIYTYPMKGTSARDKDKVKDKKLKSQLSNSIKDKAEHLMIVDLMRNDIGKISKFGTVNVSDKYYIESHPTVHQMISCISGKLVDNITEIDIIKALFPGGSVTGAPKESAMKIIDSLENYSRDIYTGAIGYIHKNGDMNYNIPIRTLSIYDNIGVYPVGGGIVWDSKIKNEWKEAQLKSKILE